MLDDDRQTARPERLHEVPGHGRHPLGQAVQGPPGPHEHRGGHVPAAALGAQGGGDRLLLERVAPDPVQRVGGQHDQVAALDSLDGGGEAAVALGEGRVIREAA